MKSICRHLVFTAILGLAASNLEAQTISAVFQQNANGQKISTDSCGIDHFASNNNLWTQSAATALDCHNQSYVSDVANWNIPSYPNGANFNVTIGLSAHLNQSVAVGNLTITNGGALAYDANNSAGAGAHSVALTLNGGTVTNDGTLTSTGVAEAGQAYQFNVPTLLTGGGTTKLGYGTVLNGPGSLTIDTNHNVIGGGNVQFNNALVNRGVINADGSTGFFDHREVSFANAQITNTGTIKTTANGAVQFLAGTVINNTGGTLSASGSFAFRLNFGVSVTGGTLVSIGDRPRKDFFQVDNATLTGVNIATGTEIFVDGGTLTLNGAITHGGLITFANTNQFPTGTFNIASNTTLSGTGNMIVSGAGGTIAPGATLTLGPGQRLDANFTTITGAITNQGLINAFSDRGLVLNGGNYRNSGTIQSSGGGYLQFGNAGTSAERTFTIDNTDGIIQAIDSSQAEFSGDITVQNGILTTAGTAPIYMQGRLTLQNVTNNGLFHFRRNCGGIVTLQLSGSLTNNGKIDDLVGECNPAEIDLLGNVSIGGNGNLVLYRSTTIVSPNGGILTNLAGHEIGGNVTVKPTLINNGGFSVGGDNIQNLVGPMVTNNGTLLAGEGGTIQQAGNSILTNYDAVHQTLNGGTYIARNGNLNLNIGPIVINAATLSLIGNNGQFPAINSLHENRGTFEVNGGRRFSTAAAPANVKQIIKGDALSNFNTITAGSNSSITVNGNYTQGSIATLNVEIGPDNPASGFSQLNVTGTANIAGRLNVTLVKGFVPADGQTFQIVNAGSLSGSFAQVFGAEVTYSPTGVTIHPNGAAVPPTGQLQNIATRLEVLTGDSVSIGGFIVTGTDPKKVIIRATGPSLTQFGVNGALPDPVLELHAADGSLITSNDNWKDTDRAAIEATGIPPSDDLESAIVRTLAPGLYSAVLKGKDNATGIGLIEAYDLAPASNSQLGNIATRGFVDKGDNVMIGGFIIGPTTKGGGKVVLRALGPSLTAFGVAGALQDPTLELHNGDGTLIVSNDNWKDSQPDQIQATGLAPSDDRESVVVASLNNGRYTAVVRGKSDTTGVGLVEVYLVR